MIDRSTRQKSANDHHPQHHDDGIAEMSAIAIIEMICDWQAAGQDSPNGSMEQSITANVERFGIGEQLESVIRQTAHELGFI